MMTTAYPRSKDYCQKKLRETQSDKHSHFEGLSGSGKTQLCLSSAISAAWIGKKVLYIDSGNGVTALRLDQLMVLRLSRSVTL